MQANHVQHFQDDLVALLAKEGADVNQAIGTALVVNLDVTVELPPGAQIDPTTSIFFAQDGSAGWGNFQATTRVERG